MIELFIAIRHTKERKFQSIISILGVAIALTVFIVSLSISNGLKQNMLNSILTLNPHISLKSFEEERTIKDYKNLGNEILEMNNIVKILPKITMQTLVRTHDESKGIITVGTNVDELDVKIIEGTKDNLKLTSVIVGNEFAKNNNLNLNDEINILTIDNKEINVSISGIFKTGFYNYDNNMIILPLKTMQILAEKGDVVDELGIMVKDPSNIKILKETSSKLNEKYLEYYSYAWTEENQNLLNAIEFEKFVLISILSLIILITSFSITAILNMVVREKITDIGILKAIGYSTKNIKKIFIFEGLIIGISGMALSIILSPILIILLKKLFKIVISGSYYIEKLPISISFLEIIIIYTFTFLLILLSTLIPASKASKMSPTEAIKYKN